MNYIPLSIPNFAGNEKKYVNEALEQGWVSTGGAFITKFEQSLASFVHNDSTAACQSGTSAIHLSLIEAGVKSGDTVIVPTLTFIAAVNPVRYQHAIPVFMDCDDSLCIDPIKLQSFIQNECEFDGERVFFNKSHIKAIIVVHVFGNMADMISIMDIAQKYNLTVIEDATEALGTYYTEGKFKGKYAGTIGHFGAYSFNGNKIITTGGGGAVTSNNQKNVDHMRYLSTQSKDDSHYYIHNEIGYNYRMTNLQAALGVAQLEELPTFIEKKQKNYQLYKSEFDQFESARLLPFRKGTSSNMWFYSLLIDFKSVDCSLKNIISTLDSKGIQTRAIWGLINEQKPYISDSSYIIEKAKYYSSCVINIPCSTQITEDDIIYVSNTIKGLLKN